MRGSIILGVLLVLGACRKTPPVPERTVQGNSLNLNATAMTPEVHINPQDAGGTSIQIGAASANLPGESERAAAAEREGQEGH